MLAVLFVVAQRTLQPFTQINMRLPAKRFLDSAVIRVKVADVYVLSLRRKRHQLIRASASDFDQGFYNFLERYRAQPTDIINLANGALVCPRKEQCFYGVVYEAHIAQLLTRAKKLYLL